MRIDFGFSHGELIEFRIINLGKVDSDFVVGSRHSSCAHDKGKD
jgi:hypothetical protein